MTDKIHPLHAFSDNYIWTFSDATGRQVCVVDPGDAQPVEKYLADTGSTLSHILITHHHADHTGGVMALKERYNPLVYGPKNSPFKGIDKPLEEHDQITVLGYCLQVLTVPGHTLDHIAYYCEAPPDTPRPLVFCGDTLFAAGCGRIFEGNPQMMYESLEKLARLPAATRVYCTHEYTLANLRFARSADPQNGALETRAAAASTTRSNNRPTLPSEIGLELATNPFLRCREAALAESASNQAGSSISDPVEVFAVLRRWKDNF